MTELPATFGKYFLTEKLATGGMAEIYLGKIVGPGGFEKPLVIKQIHPKLSGQRHFVDLFVAEAKTLVTLAHGNIVPVYELGVIDDTYFIAMEYIDGPTLYRLTEALARRETQMDPALAAWIAAKVLEGLDYAHRKGEGVIHRDLSPRNVMLSRDGEVKLVDFGIAVTLGAADDSTDIQSAPTGSFPYMSPEQVRREPLSGQSDLFSVGVLLWEMLVGHRLFARPDPDATLAAVTEGAIARPSAERSDVPAKLDEVVMRALERDQTARWGSAGDMLGALQRYLYSLEETPGPRDVASLVARYCPPETRRMPTHAEPVIGDDGTPQPAGPRTAVIPRSNNEAKSEPAKPRGKQRARTETFATHVDLKSMLDATPLFPISKLPDEDISATSREGDTPPTEATKVKPRERQGATDENEPTRSSVKSTAGDDEQPAARSNRMASVKDTDDEQPARSRRMASVKDTDDRPAGSVREPIGRQPPSRGGIMLAAVGTVALGIGAIYVFKRGERGVMRPDAPIRNDAPGYAFEPEAGPSPPDAEPITHDVAPVDSPPDAPVDARVNDPPRDVGPKPVRDAAGTPDTANVVTGMAKLDVGASPWAEVYVDGVKRSNQTPVTLEVAAGKRVVDLVFPEAKPPLKKTFHINARAGETEKIFHDFNQ